MCAFVLPDAMPDVSRDYCHSREKTMKPRQKLLAQTLLSAPLAAGLLLCAAVTAKAQPVQGLYIAGEGGATFNQDQRVRTSGQFPDGRDRWRTGAAGIGSIGWGLGNGFRVEVEGDYRNMDYQRFVTNTFNSRADGRRQTYGVMANALFDLDIGKPWLFPYFGAGIGYGWTAMRTSVTAPGNQLAEKWAARLATSPIRAFLASPFPFRGLWGFLPRRNTGSGPCLARNLMVQHLGAPLAEPLTVSTRPIRISSPAGIMIRKPISTTRSC